jgi:hypothetical protein
VRHGQSHVPRSDNHVCIKDYHSSLMQGHPSLSGALVLEQPVKGDETVAVT